jgi:citrate lyase subunit beta / citryl-CoA lyase
MLASGADALIVDLEDFTPRALRDQARGLLAAFVKGCRDRGRLAAVRINALEADGMLDLEAAMRAQPDVIAYPMADRPAQMHALDTAISHWEHRLGLPANSTEILPVCETALGVVAALTPDADELRHARTIVDSFDAARARGEDRVLVEGLWVEVPTYRNARRLLERATRLSDAGKRLQTS